MNIRNYMLITLLFSATSMCAQKKKPVRPMTTKAVPTNTMNARQKEIYESMLPNTQKIFVIDSIVVDRDKVVENIPLPSDYGQIVSYDDFFGKDTKNGQYVFINGFANKCYYTELATDSIRHLYVREKLGDGWGEPKELSEIGNDFHDISYPFMSSDGQTLYFAGTSDEGLGKLDIYMAKYNSEEGAFFEPENIGLPFNSTDDDFMYVEADADRIAWFATTRRQPTGKACIYTFALPEQRKNYSQDELSEAKLKSLASLMRIRETWPTPEIREQALRRLGTMRQKAASKKSNNETVYFVVNDRTTYTSIDDFRSDNTRQLYYETVRLSNDIRNKEKTLEISREKYHASSTIEKNSLERTILQLEQQLEQSRQELKAVTSKLRSEENKLYKTTNN